MTSAIGGVGGGSWAMQRPDTSSVVKNLFAKVDTKKQGYIDKAELQSAFDQIATDAASGSSTSSTGSSTSNVDAIFKKLDGDSDGKITEQEMSSGLQKLADQFDSQFNQSRTSGIGCAQNQQDDADAGFSKDQLTSMAKEIGSSDSKRSELMSKIADNFDQADANSDGKVNREEAMALDKASKTDSTSTDASTAVEGSSAVKHAHGAPPPPPPSASGDSASDSSTSSASQVFAAADTNQDGKVSIQELLASLQADSSSDSSSSSAKTEDSTASVMKMMMQLMQAYGGFGQDAAQNGSGISVAA